ncbi:hypothetical protein GCM10008179_00160 [Hansschlegelia plantiphila]|uniref:Uncharacterized protein n=1 Tax=Hansschlegelia plantiphila TaxID=374655 RepID=A0A9W6IYG2_9HYPH|nr:hypothetical protein GCM10008179_00160 [Hansschlegelia plantiphila]
MATLKTRSVLAAGAFAAFLSGVLGYGLGARAWNENVQQEAEARVIEMLQPRPVPDRADITSSIPHVATP